MPFDSLNDPATRRRFAYERGTPETSHSAQVKPSRGQAALFGFGDADHQPPAFGIAKETNSRTSFETG